MYDDLLHDALVFGVDSDTVRKCIAEIHALAMPGNNCRFLAVDAVVEQMVSGLAKKMARAMARINMKDQRIERRFQRTNKKGQD